MNVICFHCNEGVLFDARCVVCYLHHISCPNCGLGSCVRCGGDLKKDGGV